MSFQDDAPASANEGAAYPWILEHLLAYPGSYEIPLRTMYTLNSTTQAPQQQNPSSPTSSSSSSVIGNAFPAQQKDEQHNLTTATAAAQLRANLMSHISQLPSQPCSLPPSFVTSFVRRCFPPDLDQVDFPQALTALDYLKDLEIRRRREVVAALDRLGIDRADFGERSVLGRKYPGVLRWVVDIEDKERKVEALYTQVFLGLRRWTLVNELSLQPFNKANCIAMLNTVYPPAMIPNIPFAQPTHQLTPAILSAQRNGFFRYITAVEKNGPAVLKSLISQGQRAGEETGWPSVRETMDKYLRMANGIIDECFEIACKDSVQTPVSSTHSGTETEDEKQRRKVDSGISFTSSSNRGSLQSHQTRPSTSSSINTHSRNQVDARTYCSRNPKNKIQG
ncbi:hypothetical protein GJ744_005488 [Endocarpon pusillum]|uniref:Uncharacterized protein n=1 Tax=Endocarpon pusillum TaxID=364733 RepID=A0A8H7DYN9_9EURO|nr:hypothetical protein GJ744_005488 [Endocarpon pusillum]